jgi:ring-1,2-phenylacetyl-CoA epoxidase subunit PaaD
MINTLIREALAAIGVADVVVINQLSPAWSTDWIAPEARLRLKGYGIAPPHVMAGRVDVAGISPLRRDHVVVPCPRCESTNTQLLSQFGSTACKAQYRCSDCLEPFDYFKPH